MNPLILQPFENGRYGEPEIIHDEDDIRRDDGSKIPFIDHAVSSNVCLEGRMRYLIWYRVCDLKERTPYSLLPETSASFLIFLANRYFIPITPPLLMRPLIS